MPETAAASLSQPRSIPPIAEKPAASILIVDDEWLVRWSVTEALRDRGFDVDEAIDARSAQLALKNHYDLVLLDVHLPDVHDLRLLSLIRARSARQPVLVMTAFATREIVDEAASLGAAVLNKPFELDALVDAVEHTLAARVY
ncbi:MAG TPA: response regulator [Vicinamibacterales bacterium]|jgi:two-component system nitrogen regulation response regulator GlnG